MKFIKRVFHWDSDAGPVEKAVTVFVPVFVLVILIWLFGSCWQIFHNDLSAAAHAARPNAAIWGTVLLLAAIFWAWWNWSERIPFQVNEVVATIILMILLILSVNAYTGFFVYVR